MASEILALELGASTLSAIFYFPVPAGIKVAGAVPTPSATITNGKQFLTAGEIAALDSGDALVLHVTIGIPAGESAATTLSRLRAMYATESARLSSIYQSRYVYYGQRFDK